ncbi:hypothetical protein F4809DRAFT_611769 [Biscogniauxia mediterranea]|nr:hypothetical protein F4809DRAFT_611769 [Biscogniauxia mediterranea]
MARSSLKYTLHQYGTENDLQRVGVWDVDIADKNKYWIIYIHGGAWRDPRIALETFEPTIDQILLATASSSPSSSSSSPPCSSGSTRSRHQNHHQRPGIAAFASLDYRLSPHPGFPQDPAATPPARYRGARHPDHVDDARAALAFLQARYGSAANYVLVGHSAGGCIALQLLAGLCSPTSSSPFLSQSQSLSLSSPPSSSATSDSSTITPTAAPALAPAPVPFAFPRAIVSFEGIYDFAGIASRLGPAYAEFLSGAFGPPDEEARAWAAAAPLAYAGSYRDRWREAGGRALVLAWSPDDALVDEPEIDAMARRLRRDGVEGLVVLKDLRGDHDEIWESGKEVARLVGVALEGIGG